MSWQAEMARAQELAEQVGGLGPVRVARLFGGASLRIDGVTFALLIRGSLFLRVDDANRPAFVTAGMQPFSYATRVRTVAVESYYEAPAHVLEDAGALNDWCRDAYRAAVRAGAGKRRAAR